MSKHFLALDMPDISNTKLLVINDRSEYSSTIPVNNAMLEIYAPGYTKPAVIDVTNGFQSVFSACSLGLQLNNCGEEQAELPDGVYRVRYSVSPNDRVFVEYYFLRISKTLNKYFEALCSIEVGACAPNSDIEQQFKEINQIKNFIDSAKIKVEYAHRKNEGISLLTYAQKKLDEWVKTNKCNCS